MKYWLFLPVLLLLIQISSRRHLEPDSVAYLSMARSLAQDGSMRRLGNPHLTYAVGYPAVLSLALTIQQDPFLTSSILNAILGVIYLLGVWRWTKSVLPTQAVWITCLSIGHVVVLQLMRRPLSEPLFMALLIWSCMFLDSIVKQLPNKLDWVKLAFTSVLLAMLVTTRQVGVLVLAGLGSLLFQRMVRRDVTLRQAFLVMAIPTAVAGGVVVSWICHDQQTKVHAPQQSNWDMLLRNSSFSANFREEIITAHLLEGLRIRLSEIGRLLVPGMFGCYSSQGDWFNVNMLVYLPISSLCFLGWWRLVRRHPTTFTLMLPWYFALYVYWPSDQGGRFFAPVLPILFVSLWKGLVILPMLRTRWLMPSLVAAHALVALGLWISSDLLKYSKFEAEGRDMTSLAHKLMEETGQIGVEDCLAWPSLYLSHLLDCETVQFNPASPPRHLLWPVDRELPPGYVESSATQRFRLARLESAVP